MWVAGKSTQGNSKMHADMVRGNGGCKMRAHSQGSSNETEWGKELWMSYKKMALSISPQLLTTPNKTTLIRYGQIVNNH